MFFFFYQQKPKSIAQICCRFLSQCIKIIDECLWPQMNWVRMDCNWKKVRLTVFKFSRFRFQNALYQVIRYSFQEFSLLPSLDVLELPKVFSSQMVQLCTIFMTFDKLTKGQNSRDTSLCLLASVDFIELRLVNKG